MASNSLHPLHGHSAARRRRHSLDSPCSSPPPLPSSRFLKPIKTAAASTFPPFPFSDKALTDLKKGLSATSSAAAPTTSTPTTFDVLEQHLSAQKFREADEETRRLLIELAGEAAQKRGYVFFSEVQFISKEDLRAIDSLWRQHSNDRYGYSVQRRIWKKVDKDFTKFFIKLGWMKRLESSEVEQYNYKAFPGEFFWELTEETPEGHLPLTNALRGTQLFTCILNHPAFDDQDTANPLSTTPLKKTEPPLNSTLFNPDYSF